MTHALFARPGLGCERRGSLYAPTPACFELFFDLPTCVVELLHCSFSHALPTPGPGLHLASKLLSTAVVWVGSGRRLRAVLRSVRLESR
jgi:hypothetical protein